MTTRQLIALVAGRETRDRLTNRAFLISTAVILLAVAAMVVLPTVFSDDSPPEFALGVLDTPSPVFTDTVAAAADLQGATVEIVEIGGRSAADVAVEDGTLDAVLVDADRLLVDGPPDRLLGAIIEQGRQATALLEGLADAGVDVAEAASLFAAQPPLEVITPSGTEQDAEAGLVIGFAATVLLFLLVQLNGSAMLTGTIEEKSSRVVEVLLGSVRPWQLLAGKLTGISVTAFGQLALILAVGLGANAVVGSFELPDTTVAAVLVTAALFALGFAMYAALYAVAGSLASSVEDAQASAGPLAVLTVGAYVGTLMGVVPNPESVFARVLTLVPFTAPFATPARVAVGAISPVETLLSAVVTAVATVVAIRLAGRLYGAALLAGGRLTWREVWRAEPIG